MKARVPSGRGWRGLGRSGESMTRALPHQSSLPSDPSRAGAGEGASRAWLDVVCRLLRLPHEETVAIRAELEEHLRERSRDLMLEGASEEEAGRRAIAELGDAAALADGFRRAEHAPRRRLHVNIGMIGLAAGVAVAGAVGVQRLRQPPTPGVAGPAVTAYAPPNVGSGTITLAERATMEQLVQEIGKASGRGTNVYWETLANFGVEPKTPIGVPMAGVTVETALMLANERLGGGGGPAGERIACRMTGDLLEVSTLRHFDKRDVSLVAYDVEGALRAIPAGKNGTPVEDLMRLITSVIDPEQWRSNGGELAELHVVGARLFVKAPARFQPTVEWILGQLEGSKKGAAKEGGGDVRFTGQGDRVTATREGGASITADAIVVRPGDGTLTAEGKGAVTAGVLYENQATPAASKGSTAVDSAARRACLAR